MPKKPAGTPKKIEKRDGRIVPFEQEKITNAIWKAAQAVGGKDKERAQLISDRVAEILAEKFGPEDIPHVEEIQDIVEKTLIEYGHAKTAKAYILYRDLHNRIRDIRTLVDVNELIGSYLDQTDWRVRENANMAFSLQGLNIHVSSAMSARYWLNKIYTKEAREAHTRGDLHIHDLYLLAPYCCGWDLYDLLVQGFGGIRGKIESKPAKHFRVALMQLVNFLYTLQGEGAGAEAVSSFDTYLAPFIRYDSLSYDQVKQCMQEFAFNINVPTRVGFQTPFTNVTLDLKVPGDLKEQAVIIGGKPQKETYGEFQEEMDIFNKAFAEIMMEGDAKGRVFTFPIPTYNITKDFDWENPVLEPVWEMTAKYGIPYFCLEKSTPVVEKVRGQVEIDALEVGDEVLTGHSFSPVTNKINLEVGELIKIGLENGTSVLSTARHRFPLASGELRSAGKLSFRDELLWYKVPKIVLSSRVTLSSRDSSLVCIFRLEDDRLVKTELEELREGDAIFLEPKIYPGSRGDFSDFHFENSIYANNTTDVKVPRVMTSRLAEFLGLLVGDGSYSGKGKGLPLVTFTNADEKLLERYKCSLKELFDGDLALRERVVGKNRAAATLSFSSVVVREFLRFAGLDFVTAPEKKVPHSILSAGKDCRAAFLRGLFDADGSVDKKGNVCLASVSPALLRDVWYLLLTLGIFSRIGSLKRGKRLYVLGDYTVTFSETIGLSGSKKKRLRKKRSYRHSSGDYEGLNSLLRMVLPKERGDTRGDLMKVWEKVYYRKRAKINSRDLDTVLDSTSGQSKALETLREIRSRDLFGSQVKEVQDGERQTVRIASLRRRKGRFEVVDIEVKNADHTFLLDNGILTHNSNFINSDMKPEDARSMCCRLRLDNRELRKRGGGLFGSNPLTGSIGVVTINLSRIGYLSKSREEFFSRLSELMEVARESLKTKRQVVEKFTEQGLYPYSKVYLSGIKERFGEYWRNHFNTIGLVGGNEALLNFMGKGFEDKEAQAFLKEVLDFMREKLKDYQAEDDQMYNLEATPAEGATPRLAMRDKELYKDIIVANEKAYRDEGAAPYYTNSTQLPVVFNGDIFDALDVQDSFQTRYTGGTVFHIFLGERMPSGEATKELVRKAAENYRLPYYTITPTFSICPEHGYLKGEHMFCPECKKACEIYSRIVGYLRPVAQWNDGKQAEFSDRRPFEVQ